MNSANLLEETHERLSVSQKSCNVFFPFIPETMEPASTGSTGWKTTKRGGKRPNAGRRKLSTPVKRARYKARVLKHNASRSVLTGKFYKTERKLVQMKGKGLLHTNEYQKLAVRYVKLSKWLDIRAAEDLYSGAVPSAYEENAPELTQEDLEGDSSSSADSSSSDEVWKQ